MKIGFVADCHVGNHKRFGGRLLRGLNTRCELTLAALGAAVTRAEKLGCERFAVLGDLYEDTKPEQQVVAQVQNILRGMQSYVMLGNHEQFSTMQGDHALGPLGPVSTVVEQPLAVDSLFGRVLFVPFRPGPAKEWLPKVLSEVQGEQPGKGPPASSPGSSLLALHLGIMDEETAPWLKDAHDAVSVSLLKELCAKHGFSTVLAGNWHSRKRWVLNGIEVMQIGALCPTGFDNPGFEGYGTLAVFDTATGRLSYEEISGPRFIKVQGLLEPAVVEQMKQGKASGYSYYVQWRVGGDIVGAASSELDNLRKTDVIVDGEVTMDQQEVQAAARTAAQVARSATTLDDALAGYVGAMPLEPGVGREEVLIRVRRYLSA